MWRETLVRVRLPTQSPVLQRIFWLWGPSNVLKFICKALISLYHLRCLFADPIWCSVPALFGALSVHTFNICRKDPIRQRLAENKSRQCLLALSELSRSWPVRIWFAKAFLNLLRRLTGQGSRQGGSIMNVSSTIAGHSSLAPSASVDSTEPHTLTNINPATTSRLPSNIILSELDSAEPSHQPGHDHEALLADNQPASNSSQATEQVLYDTFLAGYIDQTFDPDLLLLNSLGSSLPFFPGGLPDTED